MTNRTLIGPLALLTLTFLVACGGSESADSAGAEAGSQSPEPSAQAPQDEMEASVPTVTIASPAEGEEVQGPDVRVVLEIGGMEIRPAGDMTPHSGHHHLYLDYDLTDPTMPVPTIPGQVIHMGDGSSEYVFEGVSPGEHRVIAVVGDFAHVPLQPWVVDTVHFTVR